MMMRSAFREMITLVVLAATLTATAAGKDATIPSGWAPSPPKIDGRADDWAGTDLAVWDKGDVNYAFRNDADKLYVLLVFKNPKFLSTIAETGIRLHFGAAGKRDKDYVIQFIRRQVPVEEAIAFLERERPLAEEEKARLRAKPAYNIYDCQVHDKKFKPRPGVAAPAFPPAHFRFAPDQKSFVYEFAIPLARDHELAAGVGASPGEVIMVGFEWGGPTKEQLKRAARTSGETSIANEEISRGRIEGMASAKVGAVPPTYSFWASVQLAAPVR